MNKKDLIPPDWRQIWQKQTQQFPSLLSNTELAIFLTKSNNEYLPWAKFKYKQIPGGADPSLAWALLKLTRQGGREFLSILDGQNKPFSFYISKMHLRDLSYIDSYASGSIASLTDMPDTVHTDQLIINGLIEEAISSSQIEGANTTRKVAKTMIEMQLTPKNKDEQMILNNYNAMKRLKDWSSRPLNDEFLLDLHKIMTDKTLDNPVEEGRFREDSDEIVIKDRVTNQTVHVPPPMALARNQLKQIYKFVNSSEDDTTFVHPFITASVLHFLIGYVHPFIDGNGRSARALFYWYLLKKNYWLFQFLPISLQIKKKDWRTGYDQAFQYVEGDEGDITYFLNYKLRLARIAIEDFIKYIKWKQKHSTQLTKKLLESDQINQRQIDIIDFLQSHANFEIGIDFYRDRMKVVYQTARTDLLDLAKKRILRKIKIGKKFVFGRGENFPSK